MAVDPYEDDEWTEDDEHGGKPSASALASQPLVTESARKFSPPAKASEEEWDEPLWKHELPDTKTEARFWGNLAHRLTKGIRKAEIRKLSVKDRIAAASVCFDKKQLLLDKPTANINFQEQLTYADLAKKLSDEVARRQRERMTVDVTPNAEEGEE